MTKNADINKHKYSGYGIGFDRHGSFSPSGIGLGRNVITFGVDMSSSTTIDNKKNTFWFWLKAQTGIRTNTECRKNAFD